MEEERRLLDKKAKRKPLITLSWLILSLSVLEIGLIIGSIVSLSLNSNDCERPIRLWLYFSIGLLSAQLTLTLFFEGFYKRVTRMNPRRFYLPMTMIIYSVYFLWTIIGFVWLLDEAEACESDFKEGWLMVWITIGIFSGILSIVLIVILFICVIACCGSFYISSFTKNK